MLETGFTLDKIYEPIENDLDSVEDVLKRELEGADSSISDLSKPILNDLGKRVRPALALFSAHAVLGKGEKREIRKKLIDLAAAIELIHTAALIHDDVVDNSMLRRRQPTINSKYGANAAIAFGDYLYSKGLGLLSRIRNPEVINCVASAVMGMCEGELTQILNRDNFQLEREIYMVVIKKKTASFMSSSCSSAVILADKKDMFMGAFSSFGLNFGIAFQIIDDCLDLTGSEEELGKSVGLDLKMGEVTLPLFFLMESGTKRNIRELGEKSVKKMLFDSGALLRAKDVAKAYINRAKEDLRSVDNTVFKESLINLSDFILGRLTSRL